MTTRSSDVEALVEAHLSGRAVEVPAAQRVEFDQAVAAHQALRAFLDETVPSAAEPADVAVPPDVSQMYEIERELGRGGMGVVFLARQRSLNRHVALKVLRPGERAFAPVLKRFRDEAQHLARLRHPHIVSIHEVGEADGEPYFTMDFIDGEPLSAVIARGAMSPSQALSVLKQVAAAVQHAHRQGIVHRDLKPGNVLLDKTGHVFVTDFGLARDVTQDSSVTRSGELLGTPQYMAPEQARGESSSVGEATDIHALGLLLFEMLTGRAAFASSSPADVLVKLLKEDPPSPRTYDRRIPRDLETICQKMLRKSPTDRYANVSALLEDVRRFEAGESLRARRPGILTRAARWSRRHWKLAVTSVLTALVTAVLAVVVSAPLLDKSFEQLVAWGDEELATDHPDAAGRVYLRALRRASEQQRPMAIGRIVQACRSMNDSQAAVDLALQVVELAPGQSFGQHDYVVAKALVAREFSGANLGEVNIWHSKPRQVLTLIKSRLELALEGGLPRDQMLDAEGILDNVKLAIADGEYPVRHHPEYLYKLPTGTADELQSLLDNETSAAWNRARAGIALGNLHERQGDDEQAISAYRKAYDLVRRVYPMYSGVKAAVGSESRLNAPDAEECALVRQLADTLHRLDPSGTPPPKGLVEFDVVGYRLPPTVHIDLVLTLCDPSIVNPHEGLPHNLPRLLPLRQDRPVRATVLDGTYRLDKSGLQCRWDVEAGDVGPLVQVDIENWPREITVRGEAVRLPPVRLRLAEKIELESPPDEAAVDLSEAELRWSPVANAANYRVHLEYRREGPRPTAVLFAALDAPAPRLRLSDLPEDEKSQVRAGLIRGRVGAWRVDAYDDDGKCIGRTLNAFRFLVGEGVDGRAR